MIKNILILFTLCCLIIGFAPAIHAQGTNIGGHVKLTLYDYTNGEKNGVKGHEYSGMALTEMIIYISSELSDKITIDLQPLFNVYTGATPRFKRGDDWNFKKTSDNGKPVFNQFRKAVISVLLPYEIELAAGIVKPRFTWEYGSELFWEEELTGGKFSCNRYLGGMFEAGIEIYKPFEVGNISLPTYLYILNGGNKEFNDNNNAPSIMIHAEPEMGAFRFQGSFGAGKYDAAGKNNMYRYSLGIASEWNDFSARAELAGGTWKDSIKGSTQSADAEPFGYYVKGFYRFAEWGKFMLHYDYVDHNFNGFSFTSPGAEKYITITPGLQLNVAPSSAIQIQYDIGDWEQEKNVSGKIETDTLKFSRLTVGWRSTF